MARTRLSRLRLSDVLQAEGLLTPPMIKSALDEQRKNNLYFIEALVRLGFVTEESIAETIMQQFSLPHLAATQCTLSPEVLNIFPERMYYEYQFIAFDKTGHILSIIAAGLMIPDVLDELERVSCCRVCQYVSTWTDINSALTRSESMFKKEQQELTSLGDFLLDSEQDGNKNEGATAIFNRQEVTQPGEKVSSQTLSVPPVPMPTSAPNIARMDSHYKLPSLGSLHDSKSRMPALPSGFIAMPSGTMLPPGITQVPGQNPAKANSKGTAINPVKK